jgi:hypothetical protein
MRRSNIFKLLLACIMAGSLALAGCGSDGSNGAPGTPGAPGDDGATGVPGAGLASENCVVCHSESAGAAVSAVHNVKEYAEPAADVTYATNISSAAIDADKLVVDFEIIDSHGYPVEISTFGAMAPGDVDLYLGKLEADANGIPQWKFIGRPDLATIAGILAVQADGSYIFTTTDDFATTDGLGFYTNATYPAMDFTYDGAATYRVGLAFGGHGGPADAQTLDFCPDGAAVTVTKNIVSTETCVKCHGNEFAGHGGDRNTVENCVFCHNPTGNMADGDLADNLKDDEADSSAMNTMIHNIHNGTNDYWIHRDTRRGDSWYNWGDTPAGTTQAVGTHPMTFPQPAYTCTACHESDTVDMSDGLDWQTSITNVNCTESCHTDVDLVAGTGHFAQADDTGCLGCHGVGASNDILVKHSTANTDIILAADLALDTPEYTVVVSMLDAAGADIAATTDIADTAAQVKIVISDGDGVIDHTTVANFDHANLFVYGPRSKMNPVLTTAAAGGGGYYASNDLLTDANTTITADSITYQLATATGLTAGTYAAYVDIVNDGNPATDTYQAPTTAKVNFQVGTTDVEKQVAGNCQACHGATIMHGGITSTHRHDTPFDAEKCGACHDYTQGGDAPDGVFDWNGAVPISKRVHAVHAGASLIDPDYTIEHAPAEGHDWSHISYPAALNDCAGSCHLPDNSSDAWKDNANELACMGCHDTPPASDHMFLMGGAVPTAAR